MSSRMTPETEPKRRLRVYVMRPKDYDMPGCACGNDDPDWSEFERLLWCARCKKDFSPAGMGVFGGPIPIHGAHMLGLCFGMLDIQSGKFQPAECCEAMNQLAMAENIARAAHAGQTEKSSGAPYTDHLERVAALVEGLDAKAVAWLHDTIEDTPVTSEDLLRAGVSEVVVRAVVWLTRRADRYAKYIRQVKESGDVLAIMVKIADLKDHLRPDTAAWLATSGLAGRYEKAWKELTGVEWLRI